jgi:tetratricopeptide (TPR) repeat protein
MPTIRCWCRAHPRILLGLLVVACAGAVGIGLICWRQSQLRWAERALRTGDLVEARLRLSRCLDYWPRDAQVLCLAARLERVEGRYDEAEALLARCVRQDGPSSFSGLEAALLQAQRGDLTDEALLLKAAGAGNPESPWILEAIARAHLSALRFRPALLRLQQWLEIQPDCLRALELQARIFEHTRRGPEAMTAYQRVLELDPERWRIRVVLAGMLLQNADLDKAASHLDILERDHADQPEVCRVLGLRHFVGGNLKEARTWLQRALAADPKDYEALLQCGKLELQMDRPGEAVKHLSQAAQLRPHAVDVHLGLASCYSLLEGKKADAALHRKKAAAIQKHVDRINEILIEKMPTRPKDPALLAEAGSRFLAIGEERRGVDWLRRALEIDPNYQPAHAALADYERRRQRDKAAKNASDGFTGPKAP